MVEAAAASGRPLPRVDASNVTKRSLGKQEAKPPSRNEGTFMTTLQTTENDETTWLPDTVDVLSCSDEDFANLLNKIRETTQRHQDTKLKKKKKHTKTYTAQQLAAMQEELFHHERALLKACKMLTELLQDVDFVLRKVRRDETSLHDYYKTLDETIERGDGEMMPKVGPYHHKQREMKRAMLRHRYATERVFLEERHGKLSEMLQEFEKEEREIHSQNPTGQAATNMTASLTHSYGMTDTRGVKMEELYDAAAVVPGECTNLELRLRMRSLLEKVRMTRVVARLPPRQVHSRLRKELLLPFSARVLALKVDDGNNEGERFVEWYVNTVIDPLAMAQLVELVPREYLVTTTVRLINACDTYLHLRQARAPPDVLRVLLEAVAEGRSDALASLALSPSSSYVHALENKEHTGIIFYAALITGQMEVLRHLISVGFYSMSALTVWLFLHPNNDDVSYTTYITQLKSKMKKYIQKEANVSYHDLLHAKTMRSRFDDELMEANSLLFGSLRSDASGMSSDWGFCETLRRFLQDRLMWKLYANSHVNENLSDDKNKETEAAVELSTARPNSSMSLLFSPTAASPNEMSFSQLLINKRLDLLQLSSMRCAVLPAVSTSFIRRVNLCGYTPLIATTSHLFLVGDTSTANAHIVQLPAQHENLWPDDDPTEPLHVKRQRERRQGSARLQSMRFYYETHISLRFLLSGIPLSKQTFKELSTTSSSSSSGNINPETMPALQTSSVFVGWCSEECVSAADGRSTHPPLGSDVRSAGVSFDILHRCMINDLTEEVILRPMKHERGKHTVYNSLDESEESARVTPGSAVTSCLPSQTPQPPSSSSSSSTSSSCLLLRVLIAEVNERNKNLSFGDFSKNPFSSPIHGSTSPMSMSTTIDDTSISTTTATSKMSIVSHIEFIHYNDEEDNKESSTIDEASVFGGTSVFCGTSAFGGTSVLLRGEPVYKSQSLVVGCHVDFNDHSASFTINGKPLGVAFRSLPSTVELRPAVSLQASNYISELLQCVNPSDAVIVRFVFEEDYLLATQMATSAKYNSAYDTLRTLQQSPRRESDKNNKKRNKDSEGKEAMEPEKKEIIPGVLPITQPLLFDASMMQCAFIRLVTCGEGTSVAGDYRDGLLQEDKDPVLLGSTRCVTTSHVRQMLNTVSNMEKILFFPPVLVKRRSDDASNNNNTNNKNNTNNSSNEVPIIPEDIPLVPLCIALTQRQRIAAYRIATHPLTDYSTQDDACKRQRRMALLASATLGYCEVLYALLERLSVSEALKLFTIRMSKDDPDFFSTGKQLRIFSSGNCRQVTPLVTQHRLEYTPLHCAILEGHHSCVHLLLYYLTRVLPVDHRKHAVNVVTCTGETALLMSCRLGYTKIAKRLLSMGASPSSFDRVTRTNCLELACASRSEEIAQALLQTPDYRSHVAVNLFGVASPLCWCALNNIGSLVQPLLRNGASLTVTLDGLTPLLLAVSFGSIDAALQILDCCDSTSTAASHATSRSRYTSTSADTKRNICVNTHHEGGKEEGKEEEGEKKEYYYDAEEKASHHLGVLDIDALDRLTQCSALHLACELGQLEVTRRLIEKGASLNLHNKIRYANPLQVAIMNGHENLALEILEYAKDKLRRGFNVLDIAAIEKNGNTALHLAAREGMLQVIEYIMLQFSEEEITRLSEIRNFAKRPNAATYTETNRQGRTPLLVAIYAHREAAAQLIASLLPDSIPNPGGPVVDGTCLALLVSDSENLDSVTLSLLSQQRYLAKDTFREEFFARYNEKRRQMDLREDGAPADADDQKKKILLFEEADKEKRKKKQKKKGRGEQDGFRRSRVPQLVRISTALLSRTSLSPESYAGRLGGPTGTQGPMLSRRNTGRNRKSTRPGRLRRRSTFVRMLLAKGGSALTSQMSVEILKQGFPLEEIYIMIDTISTETTRTTQTVAAMQHVETIISFLREYGGVRMATGDTVVFARQLLAAPAFSGFMEAERLINAKKKFMEIRPLCRELLSIIRSCGQHSECVEYLRHMIEQRGLLGSALVEEVTSPFGFTVLQLAATLGLPHVCDFFLNECGMDPLYAPRAPAIPCSESKWYLSPFRLALRCTDIETISVFISLELDSDAFYALLEHKELPEGDKLQQTAIQEIIRMPIDTLSAGLAMDHLHVLRLLLQNGAVVQGNCDIEGNDAWMLVVRECPGKGTKLNVFIEEQAPLGKEEESDEEGEEVSEEEEEDGSGSDNSGGTHMKDGLVTISDIGDRDHARENRNSSKSVWTTASYRNGETESEGGGGGGSGDNKKLLHHDTNPIEKSFDNPMQWNTSLFQGVNREPTPREVSGRKHYYARLIFSCAEHNPQSLAMLLENYPDVLSPSAVNPLTGDTLLLFLLRKAIHLYSVESGVNVLFQGNSSSLEDVMQSRHKTLWEEDSTRSMEFDVAPYRDPLTISSVRSLILVVERLLRKFRFDNLFYKSKEGHTALSLAAQLSYTRLVSLIVHQGVLQIKAEFSTKYPKRGEREEKVKEEKEEDAFSRAQLSAPTSNFEREALNPELMRNLESSSCWGVLATRLYYAEEDLETLFTIVRHIVDPTLRFSFLSVVYSNLHPIVALRVAVLYAKDVKRILMKPEAINAFWSNVLYVQFVGRLEEVKVKPAEWGSLLSVLLPSASAIPIYLIKTTPSLPASSPSDLLPSTANVTLFPNLGNGGTTTTTTTNTNINGKKQEMGKRAAPNWRAIVTKTKQYVRQLAAAAVCVASPPAVIAAAHGSGAIPSSQRHILTAMASHFHELVELAVRFDNSAMLQDLMNLAPVELQAGIKYEWRSLMEKYNVDVIAIAAGSINIIKTLTDNPESGPLLSSERYERIDPATGISEDALLADDAVVEAQQQQQLTAKTLNTTGGGGGLRREHGNSISVLGAGKALSRAANTTDARKENVKKAAAGAEATPRENKNAVVNILALDGTAVDLDLEGEGGEGEKNEYEKSDTRLQYMDVMTAARDRTTASAVTWGIGAATRPVALKDKSKMKERVYSQIIHSSTPMVRGRKGSSVVRNSTSETRVGDNARQLGLLKQELPKHSLTGGVIQNVGASTQRGAVAGIESPSPPPEYFAYYLSDWALHTTLVLHTPRPSRRTIDILLYLIDQRAPLTTSVIQLFLAASRPLNNWESSDNQLITLNYVSRTHNDSLLHLLVQNDQLQLTRYFLAAALCYFTYYQYDPPSAVPPLFPLIELPKPMKGRKSPDLLGMTDNEETTASEEEFSYPAVFLRSMLRINKHGLTPFDYARGPMVELLMEYGCVPPTYRPNPRGFCRAIRLPYSMSMFFPIPRLLLVSSDFIELHDEGGTKPRSQIAELLSREVTDATLVRNQTATQRTTKNHFLQPLFSGNVSLMHLGLCSADDELVLQYINEKREQQMRILLLTQVQRRSPTPYMMPAQSSAMTLGSRRGKKTVASTPSIGKSSFRAQSPPSRGKGNKNSNNKDLPGSMKLMDALWDRGFVVFPLVLPLDSEVNEAMDEDNSNDSTAILLTMTPMALATLAGVVKRDENSQPHSSGKRRRSNIPRDQSGRSSGNDAVNVPPRFIPSAGRSRTPAEALDAWVASRRMAKSSAQGREHSTHLLMRAIGSGLVGRTIQLLGLSPAPSYESHK